MRGDLSSGPSLRDEQFAAKQKAEQDWLKKNADLNRALELAKSVKDQEQIDSLTKQIEVHKDSLQGLHDQAEKEALAAMDRAAAEREILAQRAENLANGGQDWSEKEIADRTTARIAESRS